MDRDPHPDSLPENNHDERGDVEQIVEPRTDSVERGDDAPEPDDFSSADLPDGVGRPDGVTGDEDDAQ
jgi:hypothetical protein